MTKAEIMQELWKLSETSANPKDSMLLEIAGNLVEATFVNTSSIDDAIVTAVKDAKEHLDS